MTATGLFSWDARCFDCQRNYAMLTPREQATYEWRGDCPGCSAVSTVRRVPSAPRVLKASWPDGYRRSDMLGLKEAAKLDVLAMDATGKEKEEVNHAIDRLSGRASDREGRGE